MNFISENKKKILIVIIIIVLLLVIAKMIGEEKVVEKNTTTSPKTGWDAEYNQDFDDPFADQYQNPDIDHEELEEEVF